MISSPLWSAIVYVDHSSNTTFFKQSIVEDNTSSIYTLYSLDIDADGVDDFHISSEPQAHTMLTLNNNQITVSVITSFRGNSGRTSAFNRDVFIGPESESQFTDFWIQGSGLMQNCATTFGCVGNHALELGRAFFGVEFEIDGRTHYGWIEVEMGFLATEMNIYGWAWEDEPDTPIFTGVTRVPEPSAVFFLLFGLIMTVSFRRRITDKA